MALWGLLIWLAGCTNPDDLDGPAPDLGDFRLGHNIVVAPKLVKGPASREASREEWITSVREAIDERFGRYRGDRLYHLGISVDGYVLALPGIPVIAAPKSILILQVTVWDDARARKLNDRPKRFTVVETLSGDTVVGSGLKLTREEQMRNLSRNAAKQIETWLLEQKRDKGWFEQDEAGDADAQAQDEAAAAAAAGSRPAAAGTRQAARAASAARDAVQPPGSAPDVAPPAARQEGEQESDMAPPAAQQEDGQEPGTVPLAEEQQ